MRKEQIITRQYNLLFLIFKLFICQRFYLYYCLDVFYTRFFFCSFVSVLRFFCACESSPKAMDLSNLFNKYDGIGYE